MTLHIALNSLIMHYLALIKSNIVHVGELMLTADLDSFVALVSEAAQLAGDRPLDAALERHLNQTLPSDGEQFQQIFKACQAAITDGWMCQRNAGGIRFGRVVKPAGPLGRFSVDVVEMRNVVGPSHAHPNGEIDMIMPLDQTAKFDGRGAGWLVYPPCSHHAPTVTEGTALVLYLLPEGAIDFKASSP